MKKKYKTSVDLKTRKEIKKVHSLTGKNANYWLQKVSNQKIVKTKNEERFGVKNGNISKGTMTN